ncbi:hypothetical protein A7D27_26030 [Pseudomonas sp. 1D4]|uniref:hypothetical protein n=1 Tax=Pseudomonas sp. 1D4 TaxID=1843691 RepID=UPI00084B3C2B|nr:hypothetical protein [Pseudomonas sp. 1D4]OEC36273.1 hypothetical protein A7D27_26030 [Pseudomonas sp. 1D4]
MTAPVWGCPYHGLVRGWQLTLPNGRTIKNRFFADGAIGSVLVRVPGVPEVTRTPDEAASDTALGYQWRNAAALVLGAEGGRLLRIWGWKGMRGSLLYTRGVGRTWLAALGDTGSDDGQTLNGPLNLAPFGRFGEDDEPAHDVPVTLEGYTADKPFSGMTVWDITEDGSRAVLGWSQGSERFLFMQPRGPFAELLIEGDGQAQPFRASLRRLSGYEQAARTETIDNMTVFSGVWGWRFPMTTRWVPSGGPCDSWELRCEGGNMFLNANGIPSLNTPGVTIMQGSRSAKVHGYALGYWYENGDLQPVTLDLEYRQVAGFDMNGTATALTPFVELREQALSQETGSCGFTGQYTIEHGTFQFNGRVASSMVEELVYVLRVGGVERDRRTLRFTYDNELTMDATGAVGFLPGGYGRPGPQVAELRQRWALSIDGETIDQAEDVVGGLGLELGGYYGPSGDNLSIDEQGRFGEGNPEKWLLDAARRVFTLPMRAPSKTYSWQCWAHWWSNHLVCLLEAFGVINTTRERHRYNFTAYPGGVDQVRRDLPYPNPTEGRPPSLYGAIDPFTGHYVLGELEPVVYI